uniref:Putative secreted protein n=1 Tax=Anopheles darlingi TaxID=43151 RepID=A0A2M4D7J2_ANODA
MVYSFTITLTRGGFVVCVSLSFFLFLSFGDGAGQEQCHGPRGGALRASAMRVGFFVPFGSGGGRNERAQQKASTASAIHHQHARNRLQEK